MATEYEINCSMVLGKCARHCCVCRRFRPDRMQVHHIRERSEGGDDSLDNLFPVCQGCHTSVHSTIPFMQRFRPEEIRACRDAVYRLVEEGKLPQHVDDDESIAKRHADEIRQIAQATVPYSKTPLASLKKEDQHLLLDMTRERGTIDVTEALGGIITVVMGSASRQLQSHRQLKELESQLERLRRAGLVERKSMLHSTLYYEVTGDGYQFADDVLSIPL